MIVGLGRFGAACAECLTQLGHDVIGVDSDERLVQKYMPTLAQSVQADATDIDAMRLVGAGEVGTAVVAIGGDNEASILAASVLLDIGVPQVWAKAMTERHGEILKRIGVHRVIFPERDMGERIAHALVGRTIDYVMLDPRFAMAETTVPGEIEGQSLEQARVRSRFDVTIVCVKKPGEDYEPARAETVVNAGDELLVVGEASKVDAFSTLK